MIKFNEKLVISRSILKIAILVAKEIPNNHGGFEQLAEDLPQYLVLKGHDPSVYNYLYKKKIYKGVNIINYYDAEDALGTIGRKSINEKHEPFFLTCLGK